MPWKVVDLSLYTETYVLTEAEIPASVNGYPVPPWSIHKGTVTGRWYYGYVNPGYEYPVTEHELGHVLYGGNYGHSKAGVMVFGE